MSRSKIHNELRKTYGGVDGFYGEYEDVKTFREEFPDAVGTDDQIAMMIADDYKNVARDRDLEAQKAQREHQEAERAKQRAEVAERQAADAERRRLDAERNRSTDLSRTYGDLELERTKRRIVENMLDPFAYTYPTYGTTRYLEKERLKREVADEVKDEVKKELKKRPKTKVVYKSRPKSKKRTKSKPKKKKGR
jgi:hypothetical protein